MSNEVKHWKQPGTEALFRIDECGEWQYAPNEAEFVLASDFDSYRERAEQVARDLWRERDEQKAGWAEAFRLAVQHQERADKFRAERDAALARAEAAEKDAQKIRGECDRRLAAARDAATHAAWCDMLAAFTQEQREHIARLLAHKWWISAITMRQTEDGRDYTHSVTGEAALTAKPPVSAKGEKHG